MPEVKRHYDNLEDRQKIITEWEAKGYRMLHDDFDDLNWKQGDPIVGTMTFTDEPAPVAPVEPARDLAAEIDILKAKVAEIEKKVK